MERVLFLSYYFSKAFLYENKYPEISLNTSVDN